MKANELRIGNYVYLKSKNKWYEIANGHDIDEGTDSGDFEPIPLTEEWLLKFGFRSNNGYPLKLLCGYIKIRNGVWFFKYNKLDIELQYVHQLQNLYFALTGEELEII